MKISRDNVQLLILHYFSGGYDRLECRDVGGDVLKAKHPNSITRGKDRCDRRRIIRRARTGDGPRHYAESVFSNGI